MKTIPVVVFTALMAMPFSGQAQKDSSNGAAIFQEQCSGCHGLDGKAQTDMGKKVQAADLTSDEIQQTSDSKLTGIVKSGQKKMPAFNGKLSDDEIKSVVGYVKQFGKAK